MRLDQTFPNAAAAIPDLVGLEHQKSFQYILEIGLQVMPVGSVPLNKAHHPSRTFARSERMQTASHFCPSQSATTVSPMVIEQFRFASQQPEMSKIIGPKPQIARESPRKTRYELIGCDKRFERTAQLGSLWNMENRSTFN